MTAPVRLSTIMNDWSTRQVDAASGVVRIRTVTPEGHHVTLTLSDDQARVLCAVLPGAINDAQLCRAVGQRHELACGCDVEAFDHAEGEHRPDCPIRDTFI